MMMGADVASVGDQAAQPDSVALQPAQGEVVAPETRTY